MSKSNTFYSKSARSSLILLWICSIVLLIVMFFNWGAEVTTSDSKNIQSKQKDFFVDELLLSSQDLQLNEHIGLINISLNREVNEKVEGPEDPKIANTLPERKLVYSKILKNKIKKISSAPANRGFTIKPLPQ